MGGSSVQRFVWEKRGVAILINKTVDFTLNKIKHDKFGRFVMIVGTIGEMQISILNVYAPNEYDQDFFKDIANVIADNAVGMVLVGGDFNAVQDGGLDRTPAERGPKSRKTITLNNMITELGLVDPWRNKYPNCKDYSFFSNVHNSYSRIDFFCLSQQYLHKLRDCHIEPLTLSDHAPVILSIDLDKENYFKYWRLNVSLLSDAEVTQTLKQHMKEYFEINDNGEVTPGILWEGAKAVIRGKIIQIASIKKKIRQKQQNDLENKIKRLELEHKTTGRHSTLLELKETRTALDNLLTYKAEGALRFSKQRYYELGNRASRLLAFQLRKAQASRIVSKVRHPHHNKTVSHPKEISDAFASFYKNLYSEKKLQTDIESFLSNLHLLVLSEDVSLQMTTNISEVEVREAIKKLKIINPQGQMGSQVNGTSGAWKS